MTNFMASLSQDHAVQHHRRKPIPEPLKALNPSCNKNITLSEPNSYYPNYAGTIWTNCCDGRADPSSCQPVQTYEKDCPAGYYSCADSTYHPEMCAMKYTASQDQSHVYGYGETKRTTQQKCCPAQFSCGGSFDAPCIYVGVQRNATGPAILTNAMYVESINDYPGCDQNQISPAAVGGVVTVAIIAFCGLGGLLLWLVKKRLHRDPNRQARTSCRRKSLNSAARAKAADIEYGDSDIGTVGTRDENAALPSTAYTNPPLERRPVMHSRSKSSALGSNQNYEMESSRGFAKDDGEFNAVQLDTPLATRALDFAGITVTSEIQVTREHGNTGPATQAESLKGDAYSISSRSVTSERNYDPALLARPPSTYPSRPLSSASQDSQQDPRNSSQTGFRKTVPPI